MWVLWVDIHAIIFGGLLILLVYVNDMCLVWVNGMRYLILSHCMLFLLPRKAKSHLYMGDFVDAMDTIEEAQYRLPPGSDSDEGPCDGKATQE